MDEKMKISIITATFNSSTTIHDCILSVNEQSHRDIEHIFIDGDSSDNSVDLIKELSKRDSIIISERDSGIFDALNKGIKKASGEYIGFMHSDDFFMNNHVLEMVVKQFEDSSADVVYGDILYVSKSDPSRIIRKWKSGVFNLKSLKYGWMPPHTAVFMKKHVYEDFGNFNLDYRISADYDHLIRVLKQPNLIISYLPETITCMKVGGASNRSFKNILNKMKEDYRIIKSNELGGFFSLLMKNLRKINQFF